jgi:7-carboxy-7-deazaguanine synthase
MLSKETISQTANDRISVLRNKINKDHLLIHEIYSSIQGESSYMGIPCVFVRTTGCHLRCSYCDTEHAFFKGSEMSLDDVMKKVASFGLKLVELTGGEPLLQPPTLVLLERLVNLGYTTLIETSGAVSIAKVNRNVNVILDVKTPSSGESARNINDNLTILWPGCEVKFVIGSHEDYLYAKQVCLDYDLFNRTHVLFSPVIAMIDPRSLAEWMVSDKLPARFQMQLHRILYGETPGK